MCESCVALAIVGVLLVLAYIGSSDSTSGYSSGSSNTITGRTMQNVMRGGSVLSGMAVMGKPLNPYAAMHVR